MIESFFKFLNNWAVIKDENAEAIHNFTYDNDTAIHHEDLLSVETGKITTIIKKIQK